ncbi:MAG TPA: hypothetical protein VKO38_05545, partial [Wenzhouxiangella sp.]|nr:hypothetical protein [Wenzhouxiangella sp.]
MIGYRLFVLLALALSLAACADTPAPEPAAMQDSVVVQAENQPEVANSAPAPAVPRYTIEQFMDTEQVGGAGFSADSQRIAYSSNRSGVFNVYAQPVTGGDPVQLTDSSTNPRFFRAWFPEDDRLIFSGDEGGNELDHVYVLDSDGTVIDLTPGEGLKANFVGFSSDGSRFWIATNERDNSVFDIYEYNSETLARELLVENTANAFPAAASPDGQYVAFTKVHVRSDTDIVLWSRDSGTFETLVADQEPVANAAEAFSADGRYLFYTTDRGSEFSYLVRRDLASGEEMIVLQPDWDVMYASRSRGGNYLVVGINEDSQTTLKVLRADDFGEVEMPEMPDGNITSVQFSADDSVMAFYVSASRRPSDLFLVATNEADAQPRALTSTLNPEIDPAHLVDGEVVRFDSYDGLEIPGVLYRPHDASVENPAPMLVRVHGGPGGQARIGYRA